jgi:hypothetical protein
MTGISNRQRAGNRFRRAALVCGILTGIIVTIPNSQQAISRRVAKRPTQESRASSSAAKDQPNQNCEDANELRKNLQQVTAEVEQLRKRISVLEKDRLITFIQDQLTKEEQRGEGLQLHLLEIAEKEEPLQSRLDQINEQLGPESLDRSLSGVGSVHPERLRDEVRKRLTSEKQRTLTQLELLKQDRVRTQRSLATTDAAILRLRQKLLEALRP